MLFGGEVGMLPLTLAVLTRDYSTPNNPKVQGSAGGFGGGICVQDQHPKLNPKPLNL